MEQLGCWLTPACQTGKLPNSCILTMVGMYPLMDDLSVEQAH